jgi:hypothetical protein
MSFRYLFRSLYLAALLIVFDQAAEVLASTYPFRPASPEWRFGMYGLLATRTSPLVLADAFLLVAAGGLGHRVFLRGWAIFHFIAALLVAGGLAGFALDYLQLRKTVRPEFAETVLAASTRAAAMGLLAVGFCVTIGFLAFRASRGRERTPGGGPTDLVVASPSAP